MDRRIPEELLAPLVSTGTRLLRVEANGPRELSLRFDRGEVQILLVDGGLEIELGGGSSSQATELLDEADPWWTVLGDPLQGAWSVVDTDGRRLAIELQLRLDGENPKLITLEPRPPRIRARAIPKSEWDGAK